MARNRPQLAAGSFCGVSARVVAAMFGERTGEALYGSGSLSTREQGSAIPVGDPGRRSRSAIPVGDRLSP